jgi:hypothetical protein
MVVKPSSGFISQCQNDCFFNKTDGVQGLGKGREIFTYDTPGLVNLGLGRLR